MSDSGGAPSCETKTKEISSKPETTANPSDNDEYYSIGHLQNQIEPGKILEFRHGSHTHYALYLGYGKVMNTIVEDDTAKQAHIRDSTLREVCHDGRARVRNHEEIAEKHFQLKPRTSEEIVQAATSFNDQVVPFECDFRNCEYYCTLWRYGKGFSTQVVDNTSARSSFFEQDGYEKYKQLAAVEVVEETFFDVE